MMEVIEIDKRYRIIYDDKGYKPKQKVGLVVSKEGNLIGLDTGSGVEILNTLNIIRAEGILEGWKAGETE